MTRELRQSGLYRAVRTRYFPGKTGALHVPTRMRLRPLDHFVERKSTFYVLIRLVRMTFQPDKIETFLSIFDESSPRIRAFPGCHHLELWQDASYPNIFTTLSHWEDAAALERYRSSDLFTATWARTRPLFASRPRAFSHHLVRVPPSKTA